MHCLNEVLLVFFVLASRLCLASYGDVEPNFRRCVSVCLDTVDCSDAYLAADAAAMHALRRWMNSFVSRSCAERCEYDCMTQITQQRVAQNYPVYKYHGHWAFTRYWGLEEPASVFFSLANGLPHVYQLIWQCTGRYQITLRTSHRRHGITKHYFMKPYLQLYPVVALTAWLASAVFHAKKTERSTLIDYSTALVFLAYGLWLTLRRVVGLSVSRGTTLVAFMVETACLVWRLDCMRLGLVSYDSHMQLCIAIAVTTIGLWGFWLALGGGSGKDLPFPHNRFRCFACQLAFAAASMLELFDFPPIWGVLDAHSLWHLATVPLGFVWYAFWRQDEQNVDRQYRTKSLSQIKN